MAKPTIPPPKRALEDLAAQAVSKLGSSAIDPIEAAKAGGEATAAAPAAGGLAPAASVLEPTIADPSVVRCADVFIVEQDITVSWGPQTLRLKAGGELSEDSYGDGAIERFRERGVVLKQKV